MKNPPKKEVIKSTQISNKQLNYSDKFLKAKEKIKDNKDEFKNILLEFMKKHKFTFERFIFPVHCIMKLSINGKVINRFLDLELFKHFLYQNGILMHI